MMMMMMYSSHCIIVQKGAWLSQRKGEAVVNLDNLFTRSLSGLSIGQERVLASPRIVRAVHEA